MMLCYRSGRNRSGHILDVLLVWPEKVRSLASSCGDFLGNGSLFWSCHVDNFWIHQLVSMLHFEQDLSIRTSMRLGGVGSLVTRHMFSCA